MEFPTPKKIEKKIDQEECELKIRRDNQGRIIGLKKKGRCTKEDMLVFARENNLKTEEG